MDFQLLPRNVIFHILKRCGWKDLINFERTNKENHFLCHDIYNSYNKHGGNIDTKLKIDVIKRYGVFRISILYGGEESIFRFSYLKLLDILHKIPFGTLTIDNVSYFKLFRVLKYQELVGMIERRCLRFEGNVSKDVIRMMNRLIKLTEIYIYGFSGIFNYDQFSEEMFDFTSNLRKIYLPNIPLDCTDVMLLLFKYPKLDTLEIHSSGNIMHSDYFSIEYKEFIHPDLFTSSLGNKIRDHLWEKGSVKNCFECILYIIRTTRKIKRPHFILVVNQIHIDVPIVKKLYIGSSRNACRCNMSVIPNILLVGYKKKCRYHTRTRKENMPKIIYAENEEDNMLNSTDEEILL